MEQEKEPTITKALIDKSTSEEATRAMLKIDAEYQRKLTELGMNQTIQDGHLKMGMDAGLHTKQQEKNYFQTRTYMQVSLFDDYISQAEAVYNQHHPQETEPKELYDDTPKNEAEYIKTYNQAYLLFKENEKLTQSINESVEKLGNEKADAFQAGSTKSAEEKAEQQHDSLESRFKDNSKDITVKKGLDKDNL